MKKVLFIEDDAVVRENTAELLTLANYEVITASNGKMGIAQAKIHLPNIIICDIMMPELNGYGVLQILAKDPATQNIPFIFLSAKTEHKDVRKGMNLGADDYITKPFDESELFSAIESRLAKVALQNNQITSLENTIATSETEINSLHQLKNYIAQNYEKMRFNCEECIYQQSEPSKFIYLIEKGMVKTSSTDFYGKELITGIFNENDIFGFTSFTQNQTHLETATAIEKTTVYTIIKSEFKEILSSNFTLALELIDYLSENVSEIKDQLLQMAYSSVRKKTANTLVQFTEKIEKRDNENFSISRSDLASIAGIATETFIRTISDFKKEKMITVEGKNIKIINLEKLKKVR